MSGGAESHAGALVAALRDAGHQAELVTMPFKWYPPEELVHQMGMWRSVDLTESNGEPIDLVIALKFPAYLVRHPAQDRVADPPAPHGLRAVVASAVR